MMKYKGIYWNVFAPFIKKSITERCDAQMAEKAIKNGKAQYKKLLSEADPIGNDNPMAMNAYFAYVFVGAWLGSDKEIPPETMAEVMRDVLKNMKPFFGLTDLNRKPNKWYNDMKKYERWYNKNHIKYPTTWEVHFDEGLHTDGSYYYFTACPICTYMNKLGIPEIMPGLCATDEVMFKYQHGRLFREHTIAMGEPVCDYWVVGDKNKNPK